MSGEAKWPRDSDPVDVNRLVFEVWSKAVDTQMHFNDMSAKSRQLGLTFVVSALALAAVTIGKGEDWALPVTVGQHRFVIHLSVLVLGAAAAAVWLVRQLDLGVYHRMLRGAVAFGEDLEECYLKPRLFGELTYGMTQAISHFSRHDDGAVKRELPGHGNVYTGRSKVTAEAKIRMFYARIFGVILCMAVGMLIVTNLRE